MSLSLVVILGCVIAVLLWGWHFPHPSPLIRPLLPAKHRWPEAQIRDWLATGRIAEEFLRFFERDPDRTVPSLPGLISPADGLVTSTQIKDGTRYVVIALSYWDVHVQRSPYDGIVESIEELGDTYMDGEGRDFAFLREKICPVQKRISIRTERGSLALRLITSLSARRLQIWVSPGASVSRGQRIGKILLGSTVVLEIPEQWPLQVDDGERVWAGESLISRESVT